jgi:hypothetical protein
MPPECRNKFFIPSCSSGSLSNIIVYIDNENHHEQQKKV